MKRPPAEPGSKSLELEAALREFALGFPETYEEFPWGARAIKVRKKIFCTLHAHADGLSMSFKLPHSGHEALLLPFTEPTHYGMGKHGWVTAHFGPNDSPPVPILRDWIEESFRTIAPKTVVKALDGEERQASKKKRVTKKKTAARKTKRKTSKKKVAKKKTVRRKKGRSSSRG